MESIWILMDKINSIQYLKKWPKIMDTTGRNIISKLMDLGQFNSVYLQRISLHARMHEKEMVDDLRRKGCDLPAANSTILKV